MYDQYDEGQYYVQEEGGYVEGGYDENEEGVDVEDPYYNEYDVDQVE